MNRKIGIFDSGLGGLSILKELINVLPNEDYLFYEDSLHSPYGEKNDEELFRITSYIVEYLLKNNCKIIIIACNTATVSCLERLRDKYPNTIFVGTVPAIKIAYDCGYKDTLVLATPYTINSKKVDNLINTYKDYNQKITLISGRNLANLIDMGNTKKIKSLLSNILSSYQNTDSLVLGCTHYSLIKNEIKKILPNTILLDGCIGVVKEVKFQLEKHHLLNQSKERGKVIIENNKYANLVLMSYDFLKNKIN